jgi:DNA-binding NarL/FixJ family response regulator
MLLIDDEPSIASAFRHVVDDAAQPSRRSPPRATPCAASARRRDGGTSIFCDLHMPDMTGMQFHEALVASDPGPRGTGPSS